MGSKKGEVGGGAATGLGTDFVAALEQGLRTGTFGLPSGYDNNLSGGPFSIFSKLLMSKNKAGNAFATADPGAQTAGVFGALNDILSGGAGKLGGSLQKLIETKQSQDVNQIRARFGAGGGTSLGTPGAYAESTYRAQAAPQAGVAIGQLQLQALEPLLQMIAAMAGKGISQRSTYVEPSGFTQALSALGGAAQGAGSLIGAIK